MIGNFKLTAFLIDDNLMTLFQIHVLQPLIGFSCIIKAMKKRVDCDSVRPNQKGKFKVL
ncbi:hypothetical protein FC96_GL002368 [Secundilactobacillus kimchicus JCM 15530]|uniref:Uncharacterized protein n=1 Tax=Secundilactobacillus kimchicus JCM 15530 TaxID=1302272 RepID=A0A0R1HLM9_9LACO|nr:hypothetical protein FC96_GL002368 [Secundilactobacillus kimchicus JCM 15530]